MLVMTKKVQICPILLNYQNVGPKMNFLSVFTHARDPRFVTSEYVTD